MSKTRFGCVLALVAAALAGSACADAQGREEIRPLAEKMELPATSNSNSAFVEWPSVTTRYLRVRVNDSYQQRYPDP